MALCAILLAGIALCPPVAAFEQGISANRSQVAMINRLWGKDISIGEYMARVHPEILAGMPEKVRADIGSHRMIWWNSTGATAGGTRDSFIHVFASIGKTSRYITFGGTADTISPVPYLYVEAFLVNDAGQRVGSVMNYVYNGRHVSTSYLVYGPSPDYYRTEAWGYSSSPYHEASSLTPYLAFP